MMILRSLSLSIYIQIYTAPTNVRRPLYMFSIFHLRPLVALFLSLSLSLSLSLDPPLYLSYLYYCSDACVGMGLRTADRRGQYYGVHDVDADIN